MICSTVVRTLVFSKVPRATLAWVEEICRDWAFEQVIPCHFNGPFKCSETEFKQAFAFCYEAVGKTVPGTGGVLGLPDEKKVEKVFDFDRDLPKDMGILNGLNGFLIAVGAVDKSGEKVGRLN